MEIPLSATTRIKKEIVHKLRIIAGACRRHGNRQNQLGTKICERPVFPSPGPSLFYSIYIYICMYLYLVLSLRS